MESTKDSKEVSVDEQVTYKDESITFESPKIVSAKEKVESPKILDILKSLMLSFDPKMQFMAEECTGIVEERLLTEIASGALFIVEDSKLDHRKVL